MARLKEIYNKEIVQALIKQFGYKSTMEVPRLSKIVLNMGVGEAIADKKILDNAIGDLTKLSGQKPVITKARKSIAIWKIRTGYPIGCMVTLRQNRMYEFLDRLVSIALPRVRDFLGVSGRSFDGRGNFNLGVKEQIIFPEIDYDKIDAMRGLNITIATTAKSDAEAKALLAAFKFPFKNYPETEEPWRKRLSSIATRSAGWWSRNTRRSALSCSRSRATSRFPTRSARRRDAGSNNCRAIRARRGCATGADSPGDRAAYSANSDSGATSCARSRCAARFRASSRRAGNQDSQVR